MSDGGEMYLELAPSGSKLWRMKYRKADGKENRLSFGKYPDVSLKDARKKRQAARELIAADKDPAEVRDENRLLSNEANANTFEKYAREWHNTRISAWHSSTAKDTINRLEKDIFPEIGNLPIAKITHKHVIDALRKVEQRGAVK